MVRCEETLQVSPPKKNNSPGDHFRLWENPGIYVDLPMKKMISRDLCWFMLGKMMVSWDLATINKCWFDGDLPSDNLTLCYWKWPCASLIYLFNMAMFHSKLLVYQRVSYSSVQTIEYSNWEFHDSNDDKLPEGFIHHDYYNLPSGNEIKHGNGKFAYLYMTCPFRCLFRSRISQLAMLDEEGTNQ